MASLIYYWGRAGEARDGELSGVDDGVVDSNVDAIRCDVTRHILVIRI